MRTETRRRALAVAAVVGLLAGFLSGLFGVGGGILIVPGLVLLLGMGQRLAHGTSLAAILPIAASGVAGFAAAGAVDWGAGGFVTLGAMAGAWAGTRALRAVPQLFLRRGFAAFLVATAVRLLLGAPEAAGRAPIDPVGALALVGVGLASGALAGLLGVGGGIVIVPALVLLFSVPDAVAKGTSLLVIIPTALVGTVSNVRHRNCDLPLAALVGLLGTGSAFLAPHLAVRMSPRLSSGLFAALLLVVAARMALQGERRAPPRIEEVD
ncbi:MAG TPA: sulfite exporter TauE/SafE family protein [Actinomycetota bacterium]|nr:sulfite exporter TauE/SafE family protein [Actinomycetota bacterium]